MTAISATRRQMKEMADGTLRVQIDIDPAYRAAFLQAFPDIDMPVALAPLARDFEQPKPEPAKPPKSRQTPSQWLAMRCAELEFRCFLSEEFEVLCATEDSAAQTVRDILKVASRAECDIDPDARARFDELRLQWLDWCTEHN